MKNIAIIPARSGSKGLKDKNIKPINGKPLIAYAIESAIQSGVFSTIHVSTDSEEYAEIAKKYGADVPFLRSEEMSSDTASSWDAVKEVIERYKELGMEFDNIVLLQPTSPLRDSDDIKGAYDVFIKNNAKAVVSVCEVDHSPLLSNTLPDNNSLDGFIDCNSSAPRQKLSKYYRLNGAIYIVNIKFLYDDTFIYRDGSYAYIMDKRKSIDIDDIFDFEMAEFIMSKRDC
ncbi:MAG: acylneuraminate cytidylyltransferase family protein [Lachnospiraceae bacterium]|nr:acylneuraminate cytidylyltransferase family protein [Lachnospiraceae bacterium]